jgi:GNAT superfamily N-acetyltransferase
LKLWRQPTGIAVLEENTEYLLIYSIAVRPEAQRKGYGRALLDFADRRAIELGLCEVRLYTNEQMERPPNRPALGCSSACDRKPLTCQAVFCSSVAGAKTAWATFQSRASVRDAYLSTGQPAYRRSIGVLPERRDGVGMLSNNFWVQPPPRDASLSTKPHGAPSAPRSGCRKPPCPRVIEGRAQGCSTQRLD